MDSSEQMPQNNIYCSRWGYLCKSDYLQRWIRRITWRIDRDVQRPRIRKARSTEKSKKYTTLLKWSKFKEKGLKKATEATTYAAGEFKKIQDCFFKDTDFKRHLPQIIIFTVYHTKFWITWINRTHQN